MLELESKEDVHPICLHGENELDHIWMDELRSTLRRRLLLSPWPQDAWHQTPPKGLDGLAPPPLPAAATRRT